MSNANEQHIFCKNVEVLTAVMLLGAEVMKEVVGGEEASNTIGGQVVDGAGAYDLMSSRIDLQLRSKNLMGV